MYGQLSLGQEWENQFAALGEEVAEVFNLSNCWLCGGPGGSEEWPWLASPAEPKWWVNARATVGWDLGPKKEVHGHFILLQQALIA